VFCYKKTLKHYGEGQKMKNNYYKPWYLENGFFPGDFGGTKRALYITKHYPYVFCGWDNYGMEYMREGECHFNRNKYYRISVKYLRKALEINDKDDGTLFWLAGQYIELNQYKKAIEVLTKAIELFPDDTTFLEMRAWSYCLSGDYTSAITDCTKYVELGDKYHEWLFILGETYFRNKQYRKAAEAWSERAKYGNYHWGGRDLRLPAAYMKIREYDNAIKAYTELKGGWLKEFRLYTLRGKAYKKAGDKVHAAQDFAMAKKAKAEYLADNRKYHKEWKKERIREQAAKRKKENLLATTEKAIPAAQKSLLEQGQDYCDMGKYNKALKCFNQALIATPNDVDVYLSRAKCYNDVGKLTEALNDYTAAITIDNKNYDAYYARAGMYRVFDDVDKAIDDYSQAILCMPDRTDAYKERAQLYHKQAQFDKAIEDETILIKTMAGYFTDWMANTGNKTRDITDALNINPTDAVTLYYKGQHFNAMGKYSDAIEYYAQALQYQPDMLIAYVYRAMAYEKTSDYENAGKDYLAAWDITNRANTFIAFRLAYIYTDKHDFENAVICFSAIIKNDSCDVYIAYDNRAIVYEEMNRFDEAIEDYTAMLKYGDYWRNTSIHVKIAEVYIKMGLFDKAIEECESTSENDAYPVEAIITQGKAYMKKGDIENALDDFNAVIEPDSNGASKIYGFSDPNYHQVFFNRGLLYFEQGEYEKALQDFSKVGEFYVPEVLEKRHAVYLDLGKTKEAEETMEAIKQAGEYNLCPSERYSGKLFGWVDL
jgi:tetratricopeptide (TPR) repeat protein